MVKSLSDVALTIGLIIVALYALFFFAVVLPAQVLTFAEAIGGVGVLVLIGTGVLIWHSK